MSEGEAEFLKSLMAEIATRLNKIEKPTEKQGTTPPSEPATGIEQQFPEDLQDLLSFTQKANYWIIKPRQYLGSENFAKIASAVRGLNGEYISAGKDSHFRVPIRK